MVLTDGENTEPEEWEATAAVIEDMVKHNTTLEVVAVDLQREALSQGSSMKGKLSTQHRISRSYKKSLQEDVETTLKPLPTLRSDYQYNFLTR